MDDNTTIDLITKSNRKYLFSKLKRLTYLCPSCILNNQEKVLSGEIIQILP